MSETCSFVPSEKVDFITQTFLFHKKKKINKKFGFCEGTREQFRKLRKSEVRATTVLQFTIVPANVLQFQAVEDIVDVSVIA